MATCPCSIPHPLFEVRVEIVFVIDLRVLTAVKSAQNANRVVARPQLDARRIELDPEIPRRHLFGFSSAESRSSCLGFIKPLEVKNSFLHTNIRNFVHFSSLFGSLGYQLEFVCVLKRNAFNGSISFLSRCFLFTIQLFEPLILDLQPLPPMTKNGECNR